MTMSTKHPMKERAARTRAVLEEESRFVADIPKRIHKLIRMKCAELDVDQKKLFLTALEQAFKIK